METRDENSDSIASIGSDSDSASSTGLKRGRRSHASELLSALSSLRKNPSMNSLFDIVLVVEGRQFPAHRVVLAAASPVFARMFTNGMKESGQREVVLEELKSSSWELVIDFVYSADVELVSVSDALAVLEGAHRFQIDSMLGIVEDFLASELRQNNCCEILARADKYGMLELREKAMNAVGAYFEEVILSSEFSSLDVDSVAGILASRTLVLRSEVNVFRAVAFWIGECAERKKHRERLLDFVDLNNMNQMELKLVAKTVSSDWGVFYQRVYDQLVNSTADSEVDLMHMMPHLRYSRHLTITHTICGVSMPHGHCDDCQVVQSGWRCESANDLHWRLECWPKGYDNKYGIALSLHLKAKKVHKNDGVQKVRFHMFLVKAGQSKASNAKLSREIDTKELLERSWGFKSLISLEKLFNPQEGFIDQKRGSITVGATIYFL